MYRRSTRADTRDNAVPLLDLRAQHATIRDDVVGAMMEVSTAISSFLAMRSNASSGALPSFRPARTLIGCANGTDALLIAMRALDIGRVRGHHDPFHRLRDRRTTTTSCDAGIRGRRSRDAEHQRGAVEAAITPRSVR